MPVFRPFHEVIIDNIRNATGTQLVLIGQQLQTVTIPKNHQAIIDAWTARIREMHFDDEGVTKSIQQQQVEHTPAHPPCGCV